MPVSKKRAQNKPQAYKVPRNLAKPKSDNPKWLVPTFTSLMVLGVIWIVVYYVSRAEYPLDIGNWNMVIGFGSIMAGMLLLSRWR